ncbi:MAG: MoxR family ATPase [Oscillospiraceae bacterium]|nr:MoxR family ATPase [Oscillospiraceae bacterium]
MEIPKQSIVGNTQKIMDQLRKVIVGKDSVLLWTLAAILAKGHILLEDIPGVGKTTMAVAFSRVLGLSYNRVQFTPDVLPSDITGYSVLNQTTGAMEYRAGAVLCNLFLADELNRATSRTQSALLEAMEERQVTVDGTTYALPEPFMVIATQNPTGAAGTQLLPDSQIDRFMVSQTMGYPDPKDEVMMLLQRQGKDPMESLETVVTAEELAQMQQTVAETFVSEEIAAYAVNLVDATRRSADLMRGASPRATLALVSMAKAIARMRGRDYVVPKDVQECFVTALSHRLQPSVEAESQGIDAVKALKIILGKIPTPRLR